MNVGGRKGEGGGGPTHPTWHIRPPNSSKEFRPYFRELREESNARRTMQHRRATGAARPNGSCTEHPFHKLRVNETPLAEPHLVLQQRLGDEEREIRAGAEIELLQRESFLVEELEEGNL